MKRPFINTLGVLVALATIAPAALAIEVAIEDRTLPVNPIRETRLTRAPYTPHGLVKAAYNDRLEGIPSFNLLRQAAAFRDVTAEDLVEAAIAQGRLSETHLQDRRFLSAVENQLRSLNNSF